MKLSSAGAASRGTRHQPEHQKWTAPLTTHHQKNGNTEANRSPAPKSTAAANHGLCGWL